MQTPLLTITSALSRSIRDQSNSADNLQRINQFGATVRKFVACSASKKALVEAWRELPDHLQRRAVAIAEDLGLAAYLTGLVGQVTEGAAFARPLLPADTVPP
jgi:hypothetical protein